MKIVDKLLDGHMPNYPHPAAHNMERSFREGYRSATLEILKWAEELKAKNPSDGYPHIVTIRDVLDVLNRDVEDENS